MKNRFYNILYFFVVILIVNMSMFLYETAEKVHADDEKTATSINGSIGGRMTETYRVTVPETIKFGQLETKSDSKQNYKIDVTIFSENKGDLTIKADNEVRLDGQNGDELSCSNSLNETAVIKSREIKKNLSITKEKVKKAKPGYYKGTVNFQISYNADEVINKDKAEIPKIDNESSNTVKKATISNGMNKLTQSIPDGCKVFFIIDRITKEKYSNSEGYRSFFPQEYMDNSELRNKTEIENIEKFLGNNANSSDIEYYTMNLIRDDSGNKSVLSQINNVLEIRIPYEKDNDSSEEKLDIIRNHNGEIDKLKKITHKPSKDEGYTDGEYFVGEDCIYIYSSKYSVYALMGYNPGKLEADNNIIDPVQEKVPSSSSEPQDSSLTSLNEETKELTASKYTGTLSCRKSTSFKDKSMCEPLFYEKVDIEINNNDAVLTMYVIDPIPSYPDTGTPLSNVKLEYEGKEYEAKEIKDDSAIRHFKQASGFIEKEGDYKTTKVVVTLPKEAISQSVNAKLMCEAFINAVMKTNQKFYIVITDLQAGMTEQSSDTPTEIEGSNNEINDNNADLSQLESDGLEQKDNDKPESKLLKILGHSKVITIVFIVTLAGLIVGSILTAYWRYGRRK